MNRHRVLPSSALLAAVTALALPAAGSAAVTELGQLPDGVHGVCPDACQAISHTTGYQAKVGPDRTLYEAPADGRIVAWTVALGKPGPKQTAFFSDHLGGESSAAIVVLAADKKLARHVVAKGPLQKLTNYLGQTVQFPLTESLPIKKGQYVGLTVPSWAPLLQLALGSDTSWRASRPKTLCGDPAVTSMQTALLGDKSSATFACLYRTARLTYSATFIPNPVIPKPPVKKATTTKKTTTTPKATATKPK
jgi:hypothetical protein